jgi:hypothetical protein
MSGGKIHGNVVNDGKGGGVIVRAGTFTMSGGEISNNTALNGKGGGVYVSNGMFTKEAGGVIYGSDNPLKNTAGDGHAVYTNDGKKRNKTAGIGVTLNSLTGTSGNWE